jgi:hypothetical protein
LQNSKSGEKFWDQFRQQVEAASELFPEDEFLFQGGEFHEIA